jgi:DnaJ-class molecular chaperone
MLHRLGLCSWRFFSSVKAYNPAKNYYKVLNITESASQKDIKRSFRELAKKYHPDSTKGKEEAFKEVNEAYQVLSD